MKRRWMAVSLVVVMVVMLLTPLTVSANPIPPHENLERHEHEDLFNLYDFVSPERVPDWLTQSDPSIQVYIYGRISPRISGGTGPIAGVSDVLGHGCSETSTYIAFEPVPYSQTDDLRVYSSNGNNQLHIVAHLGLDGYASCYYGWCAWFLCGKSASNGSQYSGWSYSLWQK